MKSWLEFNVCPLQTHSLIHPLAHPNLAVSLQIDRAKMSSRSLQRMVSPRREQYSHLLDEMVGCGDMVMLDPLSEETLMENLRKRYKGGHIYVSG